MVTGLDKFIYQTMIYKKAKNMGGITPLLSVVFLPVSFSTQGRAGK